MRCVMLLCVIFAGAGPALAAFKFTVSDIVVHGHRGARAMRPENTIPAFRYALEVGVDVLELDLAVTKDNVLVISHDPHVNLDICEGKPGAGGAAVAIHSLTLAELRQYDCGNKKNPRFPKQELVKGTPMPTLDEVFELVKSSPLPAAAKVEFNIETKIVPRQVGTLMPDPATFAKLAVDAIRRHGMESRSIIQSFDHRSLVAVRKLAPKLRIAALIAENLPNWEPILTTLHPDIISPNIEWIEPESMKHARAHKVKVVPWTLNEPGDWKFAVESGVDGIISDDPAPLLAYLRTLKRHQ